jgi:hypothetical protein
MALSGNNFPGQAVFFAREIIGVGEVFPGNYITGGRIRPYHVYFLRY